MALSRWSHSEHYIYVCDEDRVQVCMFGHFTSNSILNRYSVIDRRAKKEGYGLFSRLELFLYLKAWAKFEQHLITYDQYLFRINLLRNIGHILFYIQGYTDNMPRFEKMFRSKKK